MVNDYSGSVMPVVQSTELMAYTTYADGSFWQGFMSRFNVQLSGSSINASNSPIVAMTSQSSNPNFLGTSNGLVGLGYLYIDCQLCIAI